MHWLIAQQEPIQPGAEEDWIDELMRNRWRTLLSVDDMIEGIVTALEDTGVLDNTWIFCERNSTPLWPELPTTLLNAAHPSECCKRPV